MKRAISIVALLVVAAIAAGCGTAKTGGGSAAAPSSSAAPAPSNDPSSIVAQSDDQTMQIGAALPADYPKDLFPLVKGANVVNAAKIDEAYKVTFETKSPQTDVASFYEGVLKGSSGFDSIDDRAGSGSINMVGVKEKLQLSVTISVEADKGLTLVELDISKAEE